MKSIPGHNLNTKETNLLLKSERSYFSGKFYFQLLPQKACLNLASEECLPLIQMGWFKVTFRSHLVDETTQYRNIFFLKLRPEQEMYLNIGEGPLDLKLDLSVIQVPFPSTEWKKQTFCGFIVLYFCEILNKYRLKYATTSIHFHFFLKIEK